MSKTAETVGSSVGEVTVQIVVCDTCGKRRSNDDDYYLAPDWMRLKVRAEEPNRRSTVDLDFCSNDCIIRHVEPNLYHTDPIVVQETINKLKGIEADLDVSDTARKGSFLRRT